MDPGRLLCCKVEVSVSLCHLVSGTECRFVSVPVCVCVCVCVCVSSCVRVTCVSNRETPVATTDGFCLH